MTCQTERTLTGQLGDTGKVPMSSKLETQAAPTTEMADDKTVTVKAEPTPKAAKQEPLPAPKELVQMDPPLKEIEPAKLKSMETEPSLKTEVLPDQAERDFLAVSKGEPSTVEITQKEEKTSEVHRQQDFTTAKIEMKKSESEDDINKAQNSTCGHLESGEEKDAPISSTFEENEDSKVPISPIDSEVVGYEVAAQAETNPAYSLPESVTKEVKSDEPGPLMKTTEHAQISQQVDPHAISEEEKLEVEMEPAAEMTKRSLKVKVRIFFFFWLSCFFMFF